MNPLSNCRLCEWRRVVYTSESTRAVYRRPGPCVHWRNCTSTGKSSQSKMVFFPVSEWKKFTWGYNLEVFLDFDLSWVLLQITV